MAAPIDKTMLKQHVGALSPSIARALERELSKHFDKCRLFYRIFARCKTAESAAAKITKKEAEYLAKGKKMQDILGVRVALYFKDDVDLCIEMIKNRYEVLEIVRDEETRDTFSPMRLNIVCRMTENIRSQFEPEIWDFLIDDTFEIQIRTIFSEGWHEVEHDLRYKHLDDWNGHDDLARNLNGIFATLETCDWAILNVLDRLAYQKYQSRDWSAMLRNHFRIRLDNAGLSERIKAIFDADHALAKEFFRTDRQQFLLFLNNPQMRFPPANLDSVVYIINEVWIHDERISAIVPSMLKEHIRSILDQMS